MADPVHPPEPLLPPAGEIYWDWNATTPPAPQVLRAMDAARARCWGNPASVHGAGRRARRQLEDAREVLASVLGLHPRDVLLTSGGTEANNLALASAPGLVLSRLEHPSVVRIAERLAAQGKPVVWLPVSRAGVVEVDALEAACPALPQGSWLSCMLVNHETGVIQPVELLSERARRLGLLVHCDAVQALGKVDLGPLESVHAVSFAAHKIRGPKAIGALCLRSLGGGPVPLPTPLLLGGSQERGLRPGTQDAVLAAGFMAAIARHAELRQALGAVCQLRDALEEAVGAVADVAGAGAPRAPHVSNLLFHGWRGDELVAALDLEGICVSAGSACSAGTLEPSPVLHAMLGEGAAVGGVRFSLGEGATQQQLTQVLAALARLRILNT